MLLPSLGHLADDGIQGMTVALFEDRIGYTGDAQVLPLFSHLALGAEGPLVDLAFGEKFIHLLCQPAQLG